MLSGRQCLLRHRDMKLIRYANDDRFDIRIGDHCLKVRIRRRWLVDRRHLDDEILGEIADGIEFSVGGFATGLEVRRLRYLSAAKHPNPQLSFRDHQPLPRFVASSIALVSASTSFNDSTSLSVVDQFTNAARKAVTSCHIVPVINTRPSF